MNMPCMPLYMPYLGTAILINQKSLSLYTKDANINEEVEIQMSMVEDKSQNSELENFNALLELRRKNFIRTTRRNALKNVRRRWFDITTKVIQGCPVYLYGDTAFATFFFQHP